MREYINIRPTRQIQIGAGGQKFKRSFGQMGAPFAGQTHIKFGL
jgi:hypothetical protein